VRAEVSRRAVMGQQSPRINQVILPGWPEREVR
jgi:hypothetical protein